MSSLTGSQGPVRIETTIPDATAPGSDECLTGSQGPVRIETLSPCGVAFRADRLTGSQGPVRIETLLMAKTLLWSRSPHRLPGAGAD